MALEQIHVVGGQCLVVHEADIVLTTVLGSCVSVCLYDPVIGVGGMNHYLLPLGDDRDSPELHGRYGSLSIPMLIDGLCEMGAVPSRMKAKLYGGGRMFLGTSDIGEKNSRLALELVQEAGIEIVAASLGGTKARNIRFHTSTGRTWVRVIEKRPEPFPKPANRGIPGFIFAREPTAQPKM
jgi:chemotaxis protein CheD